MVAIQACVLVRFCSANCDPAMLDVKMALVSAASGIGDIVRVTPLISVVHGLGYEVDVLLWPDDPSAGDLLCGSPKIRRLITTSHVQAGAEGRLYPKLDKGYDLATFTYFSAPLSDYVDARERF